MVILGERGLPISHTTILRWVVHYADTCEKRWCRFERPVGGNWRVDETFIKIRGQFNVALNDTGFTLGQIAAFCRAFPEDGVSLSTALPVGTPLKRKPGLNSGAEIRGAGE